MNVRSLSWLKVIPALLLLLSFLPGVEAAQARPAKLSVEYVYAPDGMLAGRTVNGQIQRFEYDKRGQLLAVKDASGNDLERYVYDPAGNILSKTVHGKTTRFTYDAANQITSRTNPDGRVIQYQYDAAGRLIQEGTRSYVYGWQDKVEEIRENGKTVARFTYGLDGQLETVMRTDGSVEHFYWDGLALIGRGKSTFVNEPYVTGGNPIASDGKAMLNDILGSTIGIRDGEKMTPVAMTAFGETQDPNALFTGKPHVQDLGYTFRFRNYRADQGKWQSADLLGYPNGWNPLAYCHNKITSSIDILGLLDDELVWFRPSGAEYRTGSADSLLIKPGDWLGALIDDYVPGGYTFATFHDNLVDEFAIAIPALGSNANKLWSPVNVPTMPLCFVAAVEANLVDSTLDLTIFGANMAWQGLCWGVTTTGEVLSWGYNELGDFVAFSSALAEQMTIACWNWVKLRLWE